WGSVRATKRPSPEGEGFLAGRLKSTELARRCRPSHSLILKLSSSWGSAPCNSMYFATTSSVTLPLDATKYPRAHRCRPQNSLRIARKVPHQPVGSLALDGLHHLARRQVRGYRKQQVNVVRPHVPLENVDVVCPTDLSD